jgi:hypothetical protein
MLKERPECEGKVSDEATACPHCGEPLRKHVARAKKALPYRKYDKQLSVAIGSASLLLLINAGIVLSLALQFKERMSVDEFGFMLVVGVSGLGVLFGGLLGVAVVVGSIVDGLRSWPIDERARSRRAGSPHPCRPGWRC